MTPPLVDPIRQQRRNATTKNWAKQSLAKGRTEGLGNPINPRIYEDFGVTFVGCVRLSGNTYQ